jgi:hypothetical protein
MATLYTQKDKNVRLTWVYITGFLVFVIGVGFVFSQAMHSSAILYGCVSLCAADGKKTMVRQRLNLRI